MEFISVLLVCPDRYCKIENVMINEIRVPLLSVHYPAIPHGTSNCRYILVAISSNLDQA